MSIDKIWKQQCNDLKIQNIIEINMKKKQKKESKWSNYDIENFKFNKKSKNNKKIKTTTTTILKKNIDDKKSQLYR